MKGTAGSYPQVVEGEEFLVLVSFLSLMLP